MQPLELQLYSFFMVTLSGVAFGLLFDLLRALRRHFRPNPWVGALGDLIFWAAATAAVSAGLFHGNWGELRFYVLVSLLLGLGGYLWLASPVVLGLLSLLLRALQWLVRGLVSLVLRVVWLPLVTLAGLIGRTALLLYRWLIGLLTGVSNLASRVLLWLLRPLVRPYRLLRLQYLLLKRRWRRRRTGPPRGRR